MIKFTSEEKMNVIINHRDGSESRKDISRVFGAKSKVVCMRIKKFKYHKIQVLKNRTIYSVQYKLDVLNYI